MGDWLFGCDVCQEVCPYNARAMETKWPEFAPSQGAGAWVSVAEVLACDEASFRATWGHTPLSRSKRRGLVRNACVVAGNGGDASLVNTLVPLLDDAEPIVRGHALWALNQLDRSVRVKGLTERLCGDVDAQVRAEAQWALERRA